MATSLNALSLIIGMNTDRVTSGVASIRQQMGRASRIFQSMKTDSDRLTEGTKALSVAFANGSISSQKMTEGLRFLEERYGATAKAARESEEVDKRVQKLVAQSRPAVKGLVDDMRLLIKAKQDGKVKAEEFAHAQAMLKTRMAELKAEETGAADAARKAAAQFAEVKKTVEASIPQSTRLAIQIRNLRKEYEAGNVKAGEFARTNKRLRSEYLAATDAGKAVAAAQERVKRMVAATIPESTRLAMQIRELRREYAAGRVGADEFIRTKLRLKEQLFQVRAATEQTSNSMAIARRKFDEWKQSVRGANMELPGFVQNIAAAGAALLSFQGLKSLFGAALEIERATLAYGVYTGSVEDAKKMVESLQKLDRESPLGALEVNRAAEMMLNFGVATERVMPALRKLGDISGGSADRFGRLSYAMSQILGLGRLTGMELRQLSEAGFNPLQIQMGKTGKSFDELSQMMSDGKFSAEMVMEALEATTSAGGRHFGFMQEYAASTSGALSQLKSSATLLAADLGGYFLPAVDKSARSLSFLLDNVKGLGEIMGRDTKRVLTWVGSFTAFMVIAPRVIQAFKAIIATVRSLIASQIVLTSLTGPKGWAIIAGGLLVATAAVIATDKALDKHNETLAETAAGQKEVAAGMPDMEAGLASLQQSTVELDKTVHNMLQGYRDQNLELIKGAKWMEQYRAIQAGATDKQLEELAMLRERNSMLQMAKELEEKRQQAVEQRQKDRIDDSKKYVQDLERDAQRVKESIQTPFQTAAQSIARLMQLLQGGFISSAEYAKALSQEVAGMRNQQQAPAIAAIEKGSQEAYARMTGRMADRREAQLKKMEEQRLIAAAQLKAQQEANRLARNMTTVARIR